jgi:transcriptional regulator with PAS, ATPase and Fis domain
LPWWAELDLRVLKHVRGVLRRRGLELSLVETRPDEPCAFAPVTDDKHGSGLAVFAKTLERTELAWLEGMLNEAAIDVTAAMREHTDAIAKIDLEDDGAPGTLPGDRTSYHGILGAAPAMQELYGMLDRISPSDSSVLVHGENGTGKELVARAIHQGSERRDRRFVVTNCSAFNDNLLDSELFGHKRGAFTGAVADKPGLFELADSGTFFLDEIGDMSPALQVKLLRVLQEGTFNRVGDTETRTVDVRIIAATHRDLRAMVASGAFREDLYYRINVISLTLPPLRERRSDVALLVEAFLGRQRGRGRAKRLSPACAAQMMAYPWPGNVRELENEIERLVVLAGDAQEIGPDLLSQRIRGFVPPLAAGTLDAPLTLDGSEDLLPGGGGGGSLPAAIEALERMMIAAAMKRHNGNKTRAAEDLKVSRRNLIRLCQKYELGDE